MENGELNRLKKVAELVDAMAEGLEKDTSEDSAQAVGDMVIDEDIFENDADINPFELSWEDPSDEPLVTDLRNKKQD